MLNTQQCEKFIEDMKVILDIKEFPIPSDGKPPIRYYLPDERRGVTVKFFISGIKGYFTVSMFSDGSPSEVFIKFDKKDKEFAGLADQWCIAISLLFQLGFPHEKVYQKFKGQRFPPDGVTNLSDVPICKSVVDMVVRYLEANFPPTKKDQDDYDRMVGL